MNDWQPIETAPKDYPIIVAEGTAVGEAHWLEDGGWWWANNDPCDSWGVEIHPTHWMPLPEPPVLLLTEEDEHTHSSGQH